VTWRSPVQFTTNSAISTITCFTADYILWQICIHLVIMAWIDVLMHTKRHCKHTLFACDNTLNQTKDGNFYILINMVFPIKLYGKQNINIQTKFWIFITNIIVSAIPLSFSLFLQSTEHVSCNMSLKIT